ncbi:dorsal root ganglia homeobox protein [Crotalus adamanteus]|uniref:Dorsal root ganglia homeobox protein n=1 Tax=Crotalus adamanteus TaxID=8729 RepID=A0AAW1BHQ2_CROAD
MGDTGRPGDDVAQMCVIHTERLEADFVPQPVSGEREARTEDKGASGHEISHNPPWPCRCGVTPVGESEPLFFSGDQKLFGGPLCSCCVPDHVGLSFLPTYGCQSNRTASVAALRMKAREHSEAVLQSANLLAPGGSPSPSPASGPKSASENVLDNKPPLTMEHKESEKSV